MIMGAETFSLKVSREPGENAYIRCYWIKLPKHQINAVWCRQDKLGFSQKDPTHADADEDDEAMILTIWQAIIIFVSWWIFD